MSKIEELLENEKVEWKRLDEIFYIRTGYTPSKNVKEYWENGEIDWFTIEDIRNRGRILEYANVKISKKGVKKDAFKKNSIILSIIATIGEYALIKTNFVVNQQFMVFTTKEEYDSKINMNFMNYYFSKVSEYCRKNRRVGNVPTVDTQKILKLEIPIPSIETQEKIVEILDKFTNYVTELQAELQARTKQYEYYRDMLLSEEYLEMLLTKPEFGIEGIYKTEWKTLGEIGSFQNGTGMPKSLFVEDDGIGAIHYGHIYTKYNLLVDKPIVKVSEQKASNLKKVYPGDLVIAKTSENIEDVMKTVAYVGHDNAVTGGHSAIFRHNENPKYLSYVFNGASYLLRQKNKLARGVKVIELSITDMEKIKIPVPTVKIQEHIVSILDKFYTLLHDSSDGLQKEIELRQKQYEYYREKLLDFKK